LPGVGSFVTAMQNLKSQGLIEPIKDYAGTGRPVLGICLGMQLLMNEGEEFALSGGLGLINGRVEKIKLSQEGLSYLRIPHIGWNEVSSSSTLKWTDSILSGFAEGSLMYFVHSYVVVPEDQNCILAETKYGSSRFCSVISHKNIIGCQFHPERSGENGLAIYRNFIYRQGLSGNYSNKGAGECLSSS